MNPMQQMLANAKRMERELKKAHEELATKEFVVKKAGIIEVTIMGDKKVKSIKIDKDALSADNEEMVEETLAMAINEAYDKVQAEADAIEERVTGQRGVLGF
ncbi:MAG: YbaB/EbfC family nucleoid-associated protein [Bacilli bacterium]|jgi:DNA-binding YbaB/EbfC family protein|nr:YbaB/EbfC family nucleoid-associated protein [Bacilli bacterium]